MTIDAKDMLNSILKSISRIDYIHPGDIPNIDLYMDQVTTFMDSQLASTKRYSEDKILTKTMINNYAKNNLLPPPVKKKYTKEHVLVLIFIYYLTVLYEEVCAMEKGQIEPLQEEIKKAYKQAESTFESADTKDRDYLQLFSFICSLSFDVYVKKLLIEKIIDGLPSSEEKSSKK